ncbi:MAG: response regulator transcription factor [Sandaracinaceae bacterium]
MLTYRHLEIAEGLFDLEPSRTYPRRGADRVVEMVGATGYRLELADELHESEPAPSGPPAAALPLEENGERFGTLFLFGSSLSDQDAPLARWATRILARGLRYGERLGTVGHQRSYEEVQAMLERTPLTPRERDVVGRLLSGASTRQIAESTNLTVATVNTYLKRIFAKLGVHSRVELMARVAGTRGVIPSEPPPKIPRAAT